MNKYNIYKIKLILNFIIKLNFFFYFSKCDLIYKNHFLIKFIKKNYFNIKT